jgi:hypothetical protein
MNTLAHALTALNDGLMPLWNLPPGTPPGWVLVARFASNGLPLLGAGAVMLMLAGGARRCRCCWPWPSRG